LWETGKIIPQAKMKQSAFFKKHFDSQAFQIQHISPPFNQILTHQSITGFFVHISKQLPDLEGYQSVHRHTLKEYPFPKLIADYIKIFSSRESW